MKLLILYVDWFFLLLLLSMCAAFIEEKVCKRGGYVNSGSIHSFKGCTIIKDFVWLTNETFTGNETLAKMEPSELEVFSVLREVDRLYIVGAFHPNFTDLRYFRNLEKIVWPDPIYNLIIISTSLKSLGLRSLKTIVSVNIVNNMNLCFADGINWNKLMMYAETDFGVRNNRQKSDCVAENMVCHEMCSEDGCWGPGNDECLSCKIMSLGMKCLDSCYYNGIYQSSYRTCGKCHEKCNETCTGPNHWNCEQCDRYGRFCRHKCDIMSYYDTYNGCLRCNDKCASGCTGPGNFVGYEGCDTCHNAIVDRDNLNENTSIICERANVPCKEGYYSELVKQTNASELLKIMAGKSICRPCHPRCKNCKGYGHHLSVCTECVNFQSDEQCEDLCPSGYYTDYSTKRCHRCSSECKECWGPRWDHCVSCLNFKVPLGDNITHEFNCSDKCPDDKPHIMRGQDGLYCSDFKPAEKEHLNVPAIAGGVLGCTFLIGIFVAVVVYQLWQRAKSRENTVKMMIMSGLEEVEPLKQSDIKPNLAQLRIVKEVELRKGGILGNGAFGTVYKALWVPEGDNVKIPVAVKVLQEFTGTNTNKEILEEAYIMASIVHPHLLKLLAVCMTSPMMLVTQLMPLGCLLDYVRSNKDKIGSKPLLNWCTQIAKGMAHLEENRLVHRDLAARNVLVQTPGYVKITDFGLAKLLDIDQEAYQATGGKVAIKWLAPECIHHRRYTHRSDVWAFGVTMWELMTYGRRPYENIPVMAVPALLEKGERLTQPGMCTIDVYMIMVKCWMADAESRPSFQELAEDFAKMARDPGRYLVIEGDSLMRLPAYTPMNERELIRSLSVTTQGTEVIMDAEEYLRPNIADGNGTEDCNRHAYLDMVGDDSLIEQRYGMNETDLMLVTVEKPLDGEAYLVPSPPEYDYAYKDLVPDSAEYSKLSKKDYEKLIAPDNPEYYAMLCCAEEKSQAKVESGKSRNNTSSEDKSSHEQLLQPLSHQIKSI